MNVIDLNNAQVLVVGAGIMGAGIAQVAAQAGHSVMLFDMREGAAAEAKVKLAASLNALVAKGKLNADAVAQTLSRIAAIDKNCRLIKGQVFLWKDGQEWIDLWDLNGEITK